MIITCSNCKSNYMVSPELIGEKGRTVKCVKCANKWFVNPPQNKKLSNINPNNDIDISKYVEKLQEQNLPVTSKKTNNLLYKLSLVSLIILGVFLTVIFQKDILVKMPVVGNLYEIVGIKKVEGLRFNNMTIKKIENGNKTDLVLRGSVDNISDKKQYLPNLRYVIFDKDGNKMLEHVLANNNKIIKAGEAFLLNNTIKNLKRNAHILTVEMGNKIDFMLH